MGCFSFCSLKWGQRETPPPLFYAVFVNAHFLCLNGQQIFVNINEYLGVLNVSEKSHTHWETRFVWLNREKIFVSINECLHLLNIIRKSHTLTHSVSNGNTHGNSFFLSSVTHKIFVNEYLGYFLCFPELTHTHSLCV